MTRLYYLCYNIGMKNEKIRKALSNRPAKPNTLTRNPSYKPNPDNIRLQIESALSGKLPKLKDRQYIAIELIMDYLSNDMEPEYTLISNTIGIDNRTLKHWIYNDSKFSDILNRIIVNACKSLFWIQFYKLALKASKKPKTITSEHIGKVLGIVKPSSIDITQQTNIITITREDGSIDFIQQDIGISDT